MKSPTLVIVCILLLSSVGCIRNEEELVVQSCEGFDFGIPERDWILLLPGINCVFSSGEKKLRFNGKYDISEPYTYAYDRNSPTGSQDNNCSALYQSTHITEDNSLIITNSIGYHKTLGTGFMNVAFQRMSFELALENDTLRGRRTNYTQDDPDDYLFENISSQTFGGTRYDHVFKISHFNPGVQPQEIYLAKREGLVAFVMKDTLWVRE